MESLKCPDKKSGLNKGGLDYFGEKLGNDVKDTWVRKTFYLTQLTNKIKTERLITALTCTIADRAADFFMVKIRMCHGRLNHIVKCKNPLTISTFHKADSLNRPILLSLSK